MTNSQEPQRPPSRCLVWSGYAVFIWSAAYGFLHLLWALGIGLSMLKPSAVEISQFNSLSTSHGIYGIIHRALQIAGVVELESGPFNPNEHAYVLWDLILFEPWFIIEGILLAIVGWCYLDRTRNRRIWLMLCAVGIIVGLITGLLGLRFG